MRSSISSGSLVLLLAIVAAAGNIPTRSGFSTGSFVGAIGGSTLLGACSTGPVACTLSTSTMYGGVGYNYDFLFQGTAGSGYVLPYGLALGFSVYATRSNVGSGSLTVSFLDCGDMQAESEYNNSCITSPPNGDWSFAPTAPGQGVVSVTTEGDPGCQYCGFVLTIDGNNTGYVLGTEDPYPTLTSATAINSVPEPSSLAMLLAGLGLLAICCARRRRIAPAH